MRTPTRELRRMLGTPVSALFSAVVAARNALYDRGILQQRRLLRPVISIGNLSVGGAGKTPFVIMLAELLRQAGVRVDVLSRGYGRTSSGVLVVDAGGDARRFGDEPLLIARRLPDVPVIVGESRYQAGLEAERRFQTDVHLLDDAFQHRRLARDFDIVLLSRRDLQDRLLPSGLLREPLSSIARAGAVIWSEPGDVPGAAGVNSCLAGAEADRAPAAFSVEALHVLRDCGAAALSARSGSCRRPSGRSAFISRSSCLHQSRHPAALPRGQPRGGRRIPDNREGCGKARRPGSATAEPCGRQALGGIGRRAAIRRFDAPEAKNTVSSGGQSLPSC